jgi:ligand-binding SRPBCC domain-containing protein
MPLTITKAERGYRLHAECLVPASLDSVFAFFSDAANLERITPPWIRFHVVTPAPIHMRQGLLIDYKLRIRGVPMRWQSEITTWQPQAYFVDEQRRGPYRFWRHEHRFEPQGDQTKVIDDVHYAVPGGPLVHALLVRRDVEKIFTYRLQTLQQLFPNRNLGSSSAAAG